MRKYKDKIFAQIILAFVLGILWGHFFPNSTSYLSLFSTGFVKCIKMIVTPIVFFSLVSGLCSHRTHQQQGKGGAGSLFVKTLIYFEIMSIAAILVTFGVLLLLRPGESIDVNFFAATDISHYVEKAQSTTLTQFFIQIVPDSFFGTLGQNNLLSVIFLAVLSSVAILKIPQNKNIILFIEEGNTFFFQLIKVIIVFSPIATFTSIAHSVGQNGLSSLSALGSLFASVLLSMLVFCVFVGLVAQFVYKISVFKLFVHLKREYVLALATSSSESVFPQLLEKLESFGASKKSVSFILPMGYSFNLDGTAIYVTAGALFIQQAYKIPFGVQEYLTLFFILLFTSKGAAGVSGAGFITLAATLAPIPGHPIPIEGLGILLGIDRFMSDARTITNLFGNTLGTLIIAKIEDAPLSKSKRRHKTV